MKEWIKRKFFQVFTPTFGLVVIVSILEISGDSAMSWTSPILPKLHSNNTEINPLQHPISKQQESWIGSLLTIGALCGSFPFSIISDKFGRKTALLLIAIPNIISYVVLSFSHNLIIFYVARFFLGIGVGAKCTLIPVYVVEIADDSNRGMLTTTTNIFATFGSLLSYCLGPYLSIMWFNITLSTIPTIFIFLFFIFGVESPYFLVSCNETEKARESLKKLKSGSDETSVKCRLASIETELNNSLNENGSFLDLFKSKTNLKSLRMALILTISEQLSGLTAFMFYAEDIFAEISFSVPAHIYPIIIGSVLFVSSFVSPFFVDSLGRRPLLLVSFMGMSLTNFVLGSFFYLRSIHCEFIQQLELVPIISMIVYIILMNVGIGSLMWSVACELFPPNLQSYALCVVGVTSWITTFVVTNFYETVVASVGKGQTFWMFGSCCAATLVFVFFYLPETKGKSFTQIREAIKRH